VSEPFDYSIRRSARARRVRVEVAPHGAVEVILPARAPERAAAAAVRELAPWIERRRAKAARARAALQAPRGTVPYLGDELELVAQPGRTRVHRAGVRLLVPGGDPRPALERWYRRAARDEVEARLQRATAAARTRHAGLSIRAQRTRWASCSPDGHMSFNWRLLLAPEEILDYVVWHEVCHLEVLDHSPRFWALLASRWPEHRRHSRWLRDYGPALSLDSAAPSARRSAA
jgi:predicted metal-dependent hydrolase